MESIRRVCRYIIYCSLILIATSSIFGYCLTRLHVPDLAAQAIVGLTSNPILIALLLNLILLVLGCIMDMAPIILIATPILLPIATSIGIDPIQFGIMVVLNCGIGLLTPPVGAVLFIGSAVAKIPMEKVVKSNITILSVYDHYPDPDHLCTRNQLMASKCICTLIGV